MEAMKIKTLKLNSIVPDENIFTWILGQVPHKTETTIINFQLDSELKKTCKNMPQLKNFLFYSIDFFSLKISIISKS